MRKILCTDPLPQEAVDMCQALLSGDAEFVAVPTYDETDFARLAADAEVLFVIHRQIDARLLALAPQLRLIQRAGVGYENVDVEAAKAAGVLVANTPGANAKAVAEHTILLMLVVIKRFVAAEQATRAGKWPTMELSQAGIGDLAGATIGLVGLGHIGRAVAQRLAPFGSHLVYHTRRRVDSAIESSLNVTYLSLSELLAASQIVSLQLPLTEATYRLFGDEQFSRMPRGSYLISVSRGGLIDEPALRRAIERGHLAGAGLDIVEHEGEGGNLFTDLPQVIVTPHTAAYSRGSIDSVLGQAFANINRVLAGEPPQDLVPELT